jgi:hypothetical protein
MLCDRKSRQVVNHSQALFRALNLMPFTGIASLWFIAVVRARLGKLEESF